MVDSVHTHHPVSRLEAAAAMPRTAWIVLLIIFHVTSATAIKVTVCEAISVQLMWLVSVGPICSGEFTDLMEVCVDAKSDCATEAALFALQLLAPLLFAMSVVSFMVYALASVLAFALFTWFGAHGMEHGLPSVCAQS